MKDKLDLFFATTHAYLAGVMDSDGFFGIIRTRRHITSGRSRGINPLYYSRAGVGQVSPGAVVLFHEFFGGSLHYEPRPPPCQGRYHCSLHGNAAAQCAKALLPYLRIKKRQAELIIKLGESKDKPRIETREGIRLKDSILEEREAIFQEFRQAQRANSVTAIQGQARFSGNSE